MRYDIWSKIICSERMLGDKVWDSKKYDKPNDIRSITVNIDKRIVTVVFNNGDIQMSKCHEKDSFDISVGVALCLSYHTFGSKTQFKKEIDKKLRKRNMKGSNKQHEY